MSCTGCGTRENCSSWPGGISTGRLPSSEPDALGVAYRAPVAIVCCVSALVVHDLTDEIPKAVQVAVDARSKHQLRSRIHRGVYADPLVDTEGIAPFGRFVPFSAL